MRYFDGLSHGRFVLQGVTHYHLLSQPSGLDLKRSGIFVFATLVEFEICVSLFRWVIFRREP